MEELNTAAIGLAVKTARERLKITANDLSIQTGITPSSLSRTEKGVRMLALDEAVNIARVFGMSVQELMDLAASLEQTGMVKQAQEAKQEFQRAIDDARAAVDAAMESLSAGSR